MVAPEAFSASLNDAKWWAHQSREPPCIITVSTAARAEQRSHRSAAVRGWAGFLSSEAFISATPPRPSEDFFDIKCGSAHRNKSPTSVQPSYRPDASSATATSSRLPRTKQRLRGDSSSQEDPLAYVGPGGDHAVLPRAEVAGVHEANQASWQISIDQPQSLAIGLFIRDVAGVPSRKS
jgi:hypothetical protein